MNMIPDSGGGSHADPYLLTLPADADQPARQVLVYGVPGGPVVVDVMDGDDETVIHLTADEARGVALGLLAAAEHAETVGGR